MTTNSIIEIVGYNADTVRAHFNVARGDIIMSAAVQSLYNYMAGEPRFNTDDRADNNLSSVEQATKFLQFRLPGLLPLLDNFFEGQNCDRDAVIVAAVCGSMLCSLSREYDEKFFRNLYLIDPTLEDRAAEISAEAYRYTQEGLKKDEAPFKEALFVAHIEAIDTMRSARHDFDRGQEDVEYINALLQDIVPVSASLLDEGKDISRELYNCIYDMAQISLMNRPTAKILAFPGAPRPTLD